MNLQQRMTHDLEFLGKAFPHLKERFPGGKWMHRILDFHSTHQMSGGSIEFQFVIQETWITTLGSEATVQVPILSIVYLSVRKKHPYYLNGYGEHGCLSFPTIYAAAEFIGRISRALTPVDASAEALESRFGGES